MVDLGVVLGIRVGELVLRHRRATKDGLVCFVLLVWGVVVVLLILLSVPGVNADVDT